MNQLIKICLVLSLPLMASGLHNNAAVESMGVTGINGPPLCGCYPCDYHNNPNGEIWLDKFIGVGCGDLQAMLKVEITEGEACTSVMKKFLNSTEQVTVYGKTPTVLQKDGLWYDGWNCADDLRAENAESLMVKFRARDAENVMAKAVSTGMRFILAPEGTMLPTSGNSMCGCGGCNLIWKPGFEVAGKLMTNTGCAEIQEMLGTSFWDGDDCSIALEDMMEGHLYFGRKRKVTTYGNTQNPLEHGNSNDYVEVNFFLDAASSCPSGLYVNTGMEQPAEW